MLFPFCGAPAARPRRSGNDFSALPTQVAVDGSAPEAGDHRRAIQDLPDTTHPAIFDGYLDGTLLTTLKDQTQTYLAENVAGMSPEEAAVAAFLR
jgi:hypothetical protein